MKTEVCKDSEASALDKRRLAGIKKVEPTRENEGKVEMLGNPYLKETRTRVRRRIQHSLFMRAGSGRGNTLSTGPR